MYTKIAQTIGILLLAIALHDTTLHAIEDAPPAVEAIRVDAIHKRDAPIKVDHAVGAMVQAIYVSDGKWRFLPEHHFVRFDDYTIMAAPPGDYMLTLGGSKIIKVVPSDDRDPEPKPKPEPPNPEPKPEPDPNPNPDGKFNIKWAVWIYEHDHEVENFAESMVMRSLVADTTLRRKGIIRRAYEEDQEAAKRFLKLTDKLPALVLLNNEGTEHKVIPAPKTREELTDAIKRYGL